MELATSKGEETKDLHIVPLVCVCVAWGMLIHAYGQLTFYRRQVRAVPVLLCDPQRELAGPGPLGGPPQRPLHVRIAIVLS